MYDTTQPYSWGFLIKCEYNININTFKKVMNAFFLLHNTSFTHNTPLSGKPHPWKKESADKTILQQYSEDSLHLLVIMIAPI